MKFRLVLETKTIYIFSNTTIFVKLSWKWIGRRISASSDPWFIHRRGKNMDLLLFWVGVVSFFSLLTCTVKHCFAIQLGGAKRKTTLTCWDFVCVNKKDGQNFAHILRSSNVNREDMLLSFQAKRHKNSFKDI